MKTEHKNLSIFTIFYSLISGDLKTSKITFEFRYLAEFRHKKKTGQPPLPTVHEVPHPLPNKKPPPKTGRERGEKGIKEPVRLRSRVRTPVRAIEKSSCASCGACSEASALQRRHNAHSARCLPFALPSLLRPSQFSAHATGSLDGLIIVTSILLFTHCGFSK